MNKKPKKEFIKGNLNIRIYDDKDNTIKIIENVDNLVIEANNVVMSCISGSSKDEKIYNISNLIYQLFNQNIGNDLETFEKEILILINTFNDSIEEICKFKEENKDFDIDLEELKYQIFEKMQEKNYNLFNKVFDIINNIKLDEEE